MPQRAALIPPGRTIGILGGGQLGRMTAIAAARLGYRSHIYAPEAESPAAEVAAAFTCAAYDDEDALARFARDVEVVTIEFENVPQETLAFLAKRRPARPHPRALAICQDRLAEKRFLAEHGIPVAAFRAVDGSDDLETAARELGLPLVLKTRRLGYDGKGQIRVESADELARAAATLPRGAVAERLVDFHLEISVITARGADGARRSYVPVENRHEGGILRTTLAPAPIAAALRQEAVALSERIAEALDIVGLLAVEMFVTRDGRLLVNELAPRPHNSGHWTLDACLVSQFEQHVRAICGLPLGSTARLFDARMDNLLGADVESWPAHLTDPGVRLHLYGKREVRPGRKMGHVTRLLPPGRD